jgi:hypothetical protein
MLSETLIDILPVLRHIKQTLDRGHQIVNKIFLYCELKNKYVNYGPQNLSIYPLLKVERTN